MKIIIPVAGAGTRLRPHTYAAPKPLLQVADKPVLGHIIDPLLTLDPDELVIVIGAHGDQLESWVRDNYSVASTFVRQDELLGLGYAVQLALRVVDGGPILVVLGDTIADCDLKEFTDAGDNVLGLNRVDDPSRFGIAEVQNNRVVGLEEKPQQPKGNLAIIGLYYFAQSDILRSHLDKLVASGKRTRGEFQLTDALATMIDEGEVLTPFTVDGWYDCGKPETMLETNRILLSKMASATEPAERNDVVLIPPVHIPDSATVERSVIGPNVALGENATVTDAIVSNSIIGEGSTADTIILRDSLVGPRVNVKGAGRRMNVGDTSTIEEL